eukprot:m.104476 g.104476  ORF g.104476 m.104476 type:complete len:511 (-) comp15247_c0_seq1:1178-2710(-)
MAFFVITGRQNCEFYNKAELLGDQLRRSLPAFHVEFRPIEPEEWPSTLATLCQQYGWQHSSSPLIWRQAGEDNPTPSLVGGYTEFATMMARWYNVNLSADDQHVTTNTAAHTGPTLRAIPMSYSVKPLSVCITGAAGQTAYNLAFSIGSGDAFGKNQPVSIRLLDLPLVTSKLHGLMMELEDCAFPLCKSVSVHSSPDAAFKNVDYAILLSAIPRTLGADPLVRCNNRRDVLRANTAIFKEHGLALDRVGKPTTKVIVVANPSATNALIVSACAKSLPKTNFSSLSRLDQNRTCAQVAAKLNSLLPSPEPALLFSGRSIRNIAIWGNHSDTMVPDLTHARVTDADGAYGGQHSASVVAALHDEDFMTSELVETVRTRGKTIVAHRRMTPAMSGSKAVCDHLYNLHNGTKEGEFTNMGVYTDNNPYGVPDGLFFSFPCVIQPGGRWQVKAGLEVDERTKHLLQTSVQELVAERHAAFTLCGLSLPARGVQESRDRREDNQSNVMDASPDEP